MDTFVLSVVGVTFSICLIGVILYKQHANNHQQYAFIGAHLEKIPRWSEKCEILTTSDVAYLWHIHGKKFVGAVDWEDQWLDLLLNIDRKVLSNIS